MSRVTLVFHDGTLRESDVSSWKLIDTGGEADIYETIIAGKKYIAKIFTDKQTMIAKPIERISEMLRRIIRLRRKCGASLPRSLRERGIPIAVGALGDRAIMLFKYVEGFKTIAEIANDIEELHRYLNENTDYDRASIARDVLRALACLEAADIIHVDVTTANTAYGSIEGRKWVYLFDLETAAIMDDPEYPLAVIPARDVHYMPVESLIELGIDLKPPDPAELPLPLLPSKSSRQLLRWALWTPTWYGLQLVAYVYAGSSPFHGLPAITAYYWRQVVEAEKEEGFPGGWPPRSMADLGFLDDKEYRELRSMWQKLGDDILAGFYQVFVVDIAERRSTPSYTVSSIV